MSIKGVTNNPNGRPTKYGPDIQAQADAYLTEWGELGDAIPSHAGLCCYIGVARSTLYRWRDDFPLFSDTLQAIEVIQERIALNGGLTNTFNATITKLVLANHGYTDKVQQDLTSSDGSMKPRSFADMYGGNDADAES